MNDKIVELFEKEYDLISKEGLFNVIANITHAKKLDHELVVEACRYSLRILAALIDEPDIIYKIAKYADLPAFFVKEEAIFAIDKFYGEIPYEGIKGYLMSINKGMPPVEAAYMYNIPAREFLILEILLDMNNYWFELMLDRVALIRSQGGGYLRLSKALNTRNPFTIRSWKKASEDRLEAIKNIRM